MVNRGETVICHGIEVSRDRNNFNLKICQSAYVLKVLERFNTQEYKPVCWPMEIQIENTIFNGDTLCSTNIARRLEVLCILWLGRVWHFLFRWSSSAIQEVTNCRLKGVRSPCIVVHQRHDKYGTWRYWITQLVKSREVLWSGLGRL